MFGFQRDMHSWNVRLLRYVGIAFAMFFSCAAFAVVVELNSTGGTSSTNGLHIFINEDTQIQVRRLNDSGQVYQPTVIPPNDRLDNGVYLRANGALYGPSHFALAPSGGTYNTRVISATSPANPAASGVQQTATSALSLASGPKMSIVWKYTTPLDFLTAEVTLSIPSGYAVSASNPVRYYHVFDTYLGGSDFGCGVSFVDGNGKRVIGTYPPASGSTCPSSTVIPTGVSIVESFRERSGRTFSAYCASGYASFFDGSTPTCSVAQSASMSNRVITSYVDTGIGIEYDFTAAGTYTFSYDFVVGSPAVPPYDHVEIQHDGSATLCPENVKVLACTSTTVPCPAGSIVSTGTLTGSITTSPTLLTVTKTPSTFSVGSGNSSMNVALQASTAGAVVLGASGMNTTPLNGTKCWNTANPTANATQSCTMTFSATPCVGGYECIATGVAYTNLTSTPTGRNPLYTKVSGQPFQFDVLALQNSGNQASTYTATSGVTVELFDDTASPAPSCSSRTGPLASQTLTLASTDLGRKTLATPWTINAASKQVVCRVTDTNVVPTLYSCSSDRFAIRPSQFTVTAPVLTNTSLTGTPSAVAGTTFALTASTSVTAGYVGTPTVDVEKVLDHYGAKVVATAFSGSFDIAKGTQATGVEFRYLDVGNLQFGADGVVDSTFADVDQAQDDCVPNSTSNTADSSGQYGCSIGSAASAKMGRWYPSHYSFSGALTASCTSGGFTYMDEDALGVSLTLKAHASSGSAASASDPVVSRYTYSSTVPRVNLAPVTISADNGGNAVALSRLGSPTFPGMPNTVLWNAGQMVISDTYAFSKLASADGPYDSFKLKAALSDPDGAVLIGTTQETNSTRIRYGQLRLSNAYGSELLKLPVPLEARYWNGTAYVTHTQDSCTTLSLSSVAMSAYAGNLTACETQISPTTTQTLSAGKLPGDGLVLSKPGTGNSGSVQLTLNVGASPSGNTCVSSTPSAATAANRGWFGSNPTAKATFGIYKSPLIYLRENY
jgi:MSHA biogenesis protein MshQ